MEQSPSWETKRFVASQKNSPHFMEPKSSLPQSQVPATCPYLEPDPTSPCPHLPLPEYPFCIVVPSTPGSSKWSLSLRCPHQKPVCTSPLHLTRYLPHPPFSSWFVRSNNIWSAVHMIKFIMSFYPLPCYLVPIRFKYFPQHPHFKHSQPMFVPLCERSSFLPIQNNRQNYSSVYFNLYIFGLQTGRW